MHYCITHSSPQPAKPAKPKELQMELASTLKSEFVNIRHTLEEDKLTVEYSLKPKDEILALLSARLQKASDELDRSPT